MEGNNRCFDNITNPMQKVEGTASTQCIFWCKEEGIEEVEELSRYPRLSVLRLPAFVIFEGCQHTIIAGEYNFTLLEKKY